MQKAQAKSMKGRGLALHGSKPHLHILMRIDRLLPCLHDLNCVFMWVGSLWPLCRDIGLALRAGDICFAENIRDAGFLFFSCFFFFEHFWKEEAFQAGFNSTSKKETEANTKQCSTEPCVRGCAHAENIFFRFHHNSTLEKVWTPEAILNYLQVSHWLLIRGVIAVKPTASICEQEHASQRGPWINISPALQSDTALQAL